MKSLKQFENHIQFAYLVIKCVSPNTRLLEDFSTQKYFGTLSQRDFGQNKILQLLFHFKGPNLGGESDDPNHHRI